MPSEQTQFWKFQNSIGGNNEATLYIYGDIMQYDLEWWNWPDDVIPHRFRQELDALGDVSRIHVRINSNGGSVFGAYSIMNLLKSHKAEIITYNDGIAASAATLIAMAGDRVVTALGAAWMIHLPATEARGNVKVFQKAIEILTTIKDTMLDVYHAKTGIDKAELENMLNEDTWLTGTEAKAKGFADEVADSVVEAVLDANNSTAVFNGLPVSLAGIPGKIVAMLEKPAAKQ
ncbi:MAG: Clp protease ClpP, partial [Oscillospiraceae bacterium]|nr:Clp protease ClpP [Oscillospiraceae bacterium]